MNAIGYTSVKFYSCGNFLSALGVLTSSRTPTYTAQTNSASVFKQHAKISTTDQGVVAML